MMTAFSTILYERCGPIALITLNRPDKLNAINAAMVAELNTTLDQVEADDNVRAIVLNGAGRAFSAGFDLAEDTGETLHDELTRDFNIIMRFWDSPKPTIAAVHTYCLGSAMEMAVACDITLSSPECRFGAPEVKFGSGIVALILPWVVGPKKAKEWLLTGHDKITAEEARDAGLINRIIDEDDVTDAAIALAQDIAANDRLAVTLTKRAINHSVDKMGFREAMLTALETDIEIETTETDESKAFNDVLTKDGMTAALAWRRKQIDKDA